MNHLERRAASRNQQCPCAGSDTLQFQPLPSFAGCSRMGSVGLGWLGLLALLSVGCVGDKVENVRRDGDGPDASTTGGARHSPGPRDQAPNFDAYDAVLEAFIGKRGLAGATTAVVHRDLGVVHVAGYGAFDAERVSFIASSSKILSVGVLMRLMDQGLVDVDAPIGTYLEAAFGDGGDDKEYLTLAQLLSNSSGLPGLADEALFGLYACQFQEAGTLLDCARDIYTTTDDDAWRSEPDTMFRYGGGQWQLAGGIAEVASGKTWAELVHATYAEPCGVASLGYANQTERAGTDYPDYFDQDPSNLAGFDNPYVEAGAYIAPEDYGKILLMHLRGGRCGDERVLSPESVARMQEDRVAEWGGITADPMFKGYGMGWWIDRDHPGVVVDGGAYGAVAWLDNARGYGAIIIFEAAITFATPGLNHMAIAATKPELDAVFDAL